MLISIIGLGGSEVIVLLLFFLGLTIISSILFYRLGKKVGYNQGKAEIVGKL